MGKLFNLVMRIVSTLLGLLMICLGGVWILQGFNIAMHTATLTVYGLSGAIRADMTVPLVATGVALVPFAILGVLLFRRLSTIAFRRLILMLLSVSGVVLIWGAVATG